MAKFIGWWSRLALKNKVYYASRWLAARGPSFRSPLEHRDCLVLAGQLCNKKRRCHRRYSLILLLPTSLGIFSAVSRDNSLVLGTQKI